MLLVTGAAGYIGSHFVREVLSETATTKILAVDNLSTGHRESLPGDERVLFVEADIVDQSYMKDLMIEHKIQAVVHFAASCYVGESESDPFKYFNNNIVKTTSLLQAMDAANVRQMVFSSSCATYGEPERMPITETFPQRPINVYGQTKYIIEQLLQTLNRKGKLNYVALCYFNAAGAHASGDIGESHQPETHLIPNALAVLTGELDCLEIFGDDYDTRDGTCIRDYIHVCDLARAHTAALQLTKMDSCAQRINLGTGYGATVKEVVSLCEEVSEKKIPVRVLPRRPGDPASLIADYALAKSLLGWEPEHDLKSIVNSAWRWEQRRRY
ncbi:MAG: UDP-glucose 4-epimerase GalE [Candidatus Obscuribacterales bacterium]